MSMPSRDKDEQPEPPTGFNTLNFYADEIDWAKIKEKVRNIKSVSYTHLTLPTIYPV